jgi:chromosome partitioning protein
MIVTVASYKGGVGKTTTAVHLAGYFQEKAPTVLIDGDPNRSATGWARRGELPFKVVDERHAVKESRNFEHVVIDTEARTEGSDLKALAEGCDLMVIPCTPDTMSIEALVLTIEALRGLGTDRYKILLTVIPPRPNRNGEEARAALKAAGFPLFQFGIPRYIAFQDAATAGTLVHQLKKEGAKEGGEAYAAIGREILP